jgi:hypothetical protein
LSIPTSLRARARALRLGRFRADPPPPVGGLHRADQRHNATLRCALSLGKDMIEN